MSSRFILPKADVGSGIKPSDGAKLFFSENGLPFSTNPKNTFTDNTDATPNANPVIADSKGVFPNIYISGSYRYVLKDKNDVQIDQEDDIDELALVGSSQFPKNIATLALAVADTTLVDGDALNIAERTTGNGGGAMWNVVLSSTVTENTFNIVQCTGVGTLSLVLRDPTMRNVVEWGAILDGSTDVSPAMQNYADFAKAINMTMRFPDGDYLINTMVNLNSPGGGDPGFRDLHVICGHEAKFSGATNSITLFNVEGQRRFRWDGGWFRKADVCFQGATGASPQPSEAYSYFNNIIFEGGSAGAIQKCYSSTTPVGVYFTECDFGTDAANDQIDLAIDLPGNDVGQSNIFKATRCTFINCVNAVSMPDSTAARLSTSFVDCRFESLNGYAVNAGTNTKNLSFTRTYFEGCGTASVKPIILNNAKVVFDDCTIVDSQNNADAFISASGGTEIEARSHTEFGATNGTRVFVDYTSIATTQYLKGIAIQGSGSEAYKALLFSVPSVADEQYIEWDLPRLSSTLTDTQITKKNLGNHEHKGFISYETETVNLVAQSTNVDLVNINIPTSSMGLRFSVESYQTVQAVGHTGQFNEWLAHNSGGTWTFLSVSSLSTVAGFTFTPTSVDGNNFKIEVQRTGGGATNTPFRALVTIRQAADSMEGAEIVVTSI